MVSVLGFDGGGSGCEAVWIDSSGAVLGYGRGGPTHEWYGDGALVEGSVADAVEPVLRRRPDGPDLAICSGPSGARARELLAGLVSPAPCVAVSETAAILAAARRQHGLVVLAGTGSFVNGVLPDGRSAFVGGAGPVIGDDGSAHDIGILAIRAACIAAQARSRSTAFTDTVRECFGAAGRWDLVSRYHTHHPGRRAIAALAPIVARYAEAGDPVALDVLDSAARRIAEIVSYVIAELGCSDFGAVILAGGANRSPAYRQAIARRLAPLLSGPTEFVEPRYRPAVGAALVGLARLSVELSPEFITRLESELEAEGIASPSKEGTECLAPST